MWSGSKVGDRENIEQAAIHPLSKHSLNTSHGQAFWEYSRQQDIPVFLGSPLQHTHASTHIQHIQVSLPTSSPAPLHQPHGTEVTHTLKQPCSWRGPQNPQVQRQPYYKQGTWGPPATGARPEDDLSRMAITKWKETYSFNLTRECRRNSRKTTWFPPLSGGCSSTSH